MTEGRNLLLVILLLFLSLLCLALPVTANDGGGAEDSGCDALRSEVGDASSARHSGSATYTLQAEPGDNETVTGNRDRARIEIVERVRWYLLTLVWRRLVLSTRQGWPKGPVLSHTGILRHIS